VAFQVTQKAVILNGDGQFIFPFRTVEAATAYAEQLASLNDPPGGEYMLVIHDVYSYVPDPEETP